MNFNSQNGTIHPTDDAQVVDGGITSSTAMPSNFPEVDAAPSNSIPATTDLSSSPMSSSEYVTPPFQDYNRAPGPSPHHRSENMAGNEDATEENPSQALLNVINDLRYQPDTVHHENFMCQLRRRIKFHLNTQPSSLTVEETEYSKLYLINTLQLNIVQFQNLLTYDFNEQTFIEVASFVHELAATFREAGCKVASFYANGSFIYTDESMMDLLLFLRLVVPRLYRLRTLLAPETHIG